MTPDRDRSRWPWRYRCPECGSSGVVKTTSCSRPNGRTYRADGVGQQRATEDASKPFFCHSCGNRLSELVDQKEMERATPPASEL